MSVSHGSKGGRPKLDLTDDERKERRRKQHEDHRRRKGIFPKPILTWEERRELDRIAHAKRWDEEYRSVWGKLPGERLSAAEFAKRFRAFQSWVRACQARNCPLAWRVDFDTGITEKNGGGNGPRRWNATLSQISKRNSTSGCDDVRLFPQ